MAADVDFVPYPPRPSAALRRDLERLNVREGSPNVLVLAAFEALKAAHDSNDRGAALHGSVDAGADGSPRRAAAASSSSCRHP